MYSIYLVVVLLRMKLNVKLKNTYLFTQSVIQNTNYFKQI